MHCYSVIVMSIGAVRMHRGLTDRVALCGHEAGIVDNKEQSVKTATQFTNSSHPSYGEEGTHGAGGGVFTSLFLIMPEMKWFGGKRDDGCTGKEVV
jgi:hypothetical protein